MKITLIIFLLMGFTLTAYAQTLKHTETVVLNGMDTYYEVYGEGPPLLFLHGAMQSSAFWLDYVDGFLDTYEVYLVDLLGHGRSSPLRDGFSYRTAIEQISDLLEHLGIEHFSGIGFSLGGETMLQYAVTHPGQLNRMIIVGGSHHYQGTDMGPTYSELSTERLEELRAIHVHGDLQIKALYEVLTSSLVFRLDVNDVKKISTKTLVVFGERDSVIGGNPIRSLQLALELHELLPDSHLWIVPNEGHLPFNGPGKPEFVRNANEFLSGKWE